MSLNQKYAFYGIVIFNVLIKLIFLGSNCYGFDEIVSVKDTLLEFGHVKHEAEWDNNPPFYYYCLWVWHAIVPINEFNSRLLSVLFVSFAIGLIYKFTCEKLNNRVAIFTVIVLSLSNFLHYYAQESRAYSLVLLLAVSSSILFFKYIESNKISTLFWLSLINFLLIYTHYISALIIVCQFILFPIFVKEKKKVFYGIQSTVIVALVLWRFTKKQYLNIIGFNKKGDFWLSTADANDLRVAIKSMFGSELVVGFFVVFALAFLFKNKTAFAKNAAAIYCTVLALLPTIVLFTVGMYKAVFLARYLIFTVPFFFLSMFYFIDAFEKVRSWSFIILCGYFGYSYQLRKPESADFRLIAKVIYNLKKPTDYVIINRADNLLPITYYYDRGVFLKGKEATGIMKSQNIIGFNSAAEALGTIRPGSIVYLVQGSDNHFDPENKFQKEIIASGYKLYDSKSAHGLHLSVVKLR